MKNRFKLNHNEKTRYYLKYENKKLTKNLTRIIIGKNYISKLVNSDEKEWIKHYYFISGEKGFNSILIKHIYDVAFTNKDNEIIFLEQSFPTNKISNHFEDLRYIYLMPEKTIIKNKIELGKILKHYKF